MSEIVGLRQRELLRHVRAGGVSVTGRSNGSGTLWEKLWKHEEGRWLSKVCASGCFVGWHDHGSEEAFVAAWQRDIREGCWFRHAPIRHHKHPQEARMMTDGERLDPCPFCGGDAERKTHDWRVPDSNAPMIRHAVDCPDGRGGCGARTRWFPTAKEAVLAWNRRETGQLAATLKKQRDHAREQERHAAVAGSLSDASYYAGIRCGLDLAIDAAMDATTEPEEEG